MSHVDWVWYYGCEMEDSNRTIKIVGQLVKVIETMLCVSRNSKLCSTRQSDPDQQPQVADEVAGQREHQHCAQVHVEHVGVEGVGAEHCAW